MNAMVPVSWAGKPFGAYTGDVYHDLMPAGISLAEVVERVPNLPAYFDEHGVVCVNGEPVPREMWRYVRPRVAGPVPVSVTLHVPAGHLGGARGATGNNKQLFAVIANIALIALTLAIPALGVPFLGIVKATWQAKALALSVGLIGSLAITALTPPPAKQSTPAPIANPDAAAASGNVLDPGGVIPRVVGTFKAFPPMVAEPFVDLVNDDETVTATYGLADPHQLNDIRINNIPVTDLALTSTGAFAPALQYETREGWPTDTALTLHTVSTKTQQPSIELGYQKWDPNHLKIASGGGSGQLLDQVHPLNNLQTWQGFTTAKAPDKVMLHVYFPQGINDVNDPNHQTGIPIRIRIRPLGAAQWANFPEVHFWYNYTGLIRKNIRIIWGTAPTFVAPGTANTFALAYKTVPVQDVTLPAGSTVGGWTAHPSFSAGAGSDVMSSSGAGNVLNVRLFLDSCEFYLSPNTFPKGYYEIQIMRGAPINTGSFTTTSYSYNNGDVSTVLDMFGYYRTPNSSLQYCIPSLGSSSSPPTLTNTMFLMRIVSWFNRPPVLQPSNLALITIQAKNLTLSNVSTLASGYVKDYVGSPAGWTNWTTTSNPAPHFRDMLIGRLNKRALSVSQLDDASLIAWRQHCINQGYTCNNIFDGKSIWDNSLILGGCGYARLAKSEVWGVAIDQDRSQMSPVQMFNPRNMSNFKWTKAFPFLPDYFICTYRDATVDYTEQQVLVYAAGFGTGSPKTVASLPESVDYQGLVAQADVVARATFDHAQARERGVFYQGDVGPENIVCRRGDLVAVQHDTLAYYAGSARIISKTVNAGLVTGLVLDSVIPLTGTGNDFFAIPDVFTDPDIFGPGSRIGCAIRLSDDTVLVKEIDATAGGEAASLAFLTPFPDPGDSLGEDCLVSTGILGSEYKRLVVLSVQPNDELVATVVMVDEASDLFPSPIIPQPVIINLVQDDVNLNLRTIYDGMGFKTPTHGQIITFNLAAGVTIGSATASTPSIDAGSWPASTVILFNNFGSILAAGGVGAVGGPGGLVGNPGGTALYTRYPMSVFNAGKIYGGGGGGGGVEVQRTFGTHFDEGPGGGGGAGSAGGPAGASVGPNHGSGSPASNGVPSTGGTGGHWTDDALSGTPFDGNTDVADGGTGGTPGQAGSVGTSTITGFATSSSLYAPGAGGSSVDGNSFISFSTLGDVKGTRIN